MAAARGYAIKVFFINGKNLTALKIILLLTKRASQFKSLIFTLVHCGKKIL